MKFIAAVRNAVQEGKRKMKKFRFEIQNCINVEIEGDNKDDARMKLINSLEDYGDEMVRDSYVSNGVEVE